MHAPLPLFSLFSPPYRACRPLHEPLRWFEDNPCPRGTALVWNLDKGLTEDAMEVAEGRPGGVALMAILPPSAEINGQMSVFELLERCRPQTVLPHHPRPAPEDMAALLARPPEDLPQELVDYLLWRGVDADRDTRRLLRRTVELSAELRTITALSRGLYLSRRALGRRMRKLGLPVPSHWLQFCRILRGALKLQNSRENLFSVAMSLGYPDGFTLSNQMERLTGARPSEARSHLGWEWLVEAWLRMERRTGGLRSPLRSADPALWATSGGGATAASA